MSSVLVAVEGAETGAGAEAGAEERPQAERVTAARAATRGYFKTFLQGRSRG
jgi:hypothetical protein